MLVYILMPYRFHIDIAEVATQEGKLQLFVAIDRSCKFAYTELHEKKTKMIAKDKEIVIFG